MNDEKLRKQQLDSRQTSVLPGKSSKTDILPGDTVTNIAPQPKHNVRDMYMVTSKSDNKVTLQRLLHPQTKSNTKFMSKEYTTDTKRLQLLHRPPKTDMEQYTETLHQPGLQKRTPQPVWTPTSRWFYRQRELSSDDDSDDEEDRQVEQVAPVDIPVDNPIDIHEDIQVDNTEEIPVDNPVDIPEEIQVDIHVENYIDIPIYIPENTLHNIPEDQAVAGEYITSNLANSVIVLVSKIWILP